MYNDCTRQPLDNHVPVNLHLMQSQDKWMTDEMIKEEDSFVYLNLIKKHPGGICDWLNLIYESLKDQSVDREKAASKLENDNGNDVIEWVDPRQRAVDTGCFEEIKKSLERIENKERVKEEKGFRSRIGHQSILRTQPQEYYHNLTKGDWYCDHRSQMAGNEFSCFAKLKFEIDSDEAEDIASYRISQLSLLREEGRYICRPGLIGSNKSQSEKKEDEVEPPNKTATISLKKVNKWFQEAKKEISKIQGTSNALSKAINTVGEVYSLPIEVWVWLTVARYGAQTQNRAVLNVGSVRGLESNCKRPEPGHPLMMNMMEEDRERLRELFGSLWAI
ncbi:hypothetical protein PPACK8108_LOCUS6038 [Phakopsora pachyrhizi]|uniref:Uncharacterized protein n=1 Tax=Phakopsora pachyrhizi TaxID=170000 RepID=A0AAV0ASX3_PHAPC|nr:hypothetical protein PPACK8108_LOCUS6038 [Phakopsora pachyrhizi]